MRKDLLPRLTVSPVDDYELLYVLEQYYGSAGVAGSRTLVYPSSPNPALKLYWKNGRVIGIEPGASFSDLAALRTMIEATLITSPATRVLTSVLFSSPRRVSGYFRTDQIQIHPAFPSAPVPDEMMGDHPFYLQLRLPHSADGFVTNQRFARRTQEHAWTLNAILRGSIRSHGSRSKKMWAFCKHGRPEPLDWHVHWTQEFYRDPGLPGASDDFLEPAVPSIALIPHDDYYRADHLPGGDDLVWPDSLPAMLEIVDGLQHAASRRFLRAARWIAAARDLWEYHVSSWYVALVAAIESLMEDQEAERCPNCKQVKGVTQRFRDFVEGCLHGTASEEIDKKRLYRVRSDLAHGRILFDIDEAPWAGMTIRPHYLDEREAWDGLSRVITRVLVGWLLRRARGV